PMVAPAAMAPSDTHAATHEHGRASAPMTTAPAPAYVTPAAVVSTWVRPEYDFHGRSAAGADAATSQAAAPATKPVMPQE
ncbi:hypothetical protein ABY58_10135, partial [Edwardsiella ictaluri]